MTTKIERNAHVFHVCQRLTPGLRIFSRPKVFDLYMEKLEQAAAGNNCTNLFYLIMPTHSHLMLGVPDYRVGAEMLRSANSGFARSIVKKKDEKGNPIVTEKHIFREHPKFTAITDFRSLLRECRYIAHNADEIQIKKDKAGKPYFASALYGFTYALPGFGENHPLLKMLIMDVDEFMRIMLMDDYQYKKAEEEILSRYSREYQDRFLKIDPSIPFNGSIPADRDRDPFAFLDNKDEGI